MADPTPSQVSEDETKITSRTVSGCATRLITESFPAVKVLALSMHRDRRFVEGMLAAGACGYVLKEDALGQLPGALRTVTGGGTYLCPELG